MARSATLYILILGLWALFHGGAAEYQPQNMSDCLRAINALPNPLDPGSGLSKGSYVAPAHGMTILGDTCMIFCGIPPTTESGENLRPAIRPISVADETTLVTRISTSSTSSSAGHTTKLITSISTSTTSSSSSTSVPKPTTKFITTDLTKFPGASDTMWIGGGDKPSTWWVVGGAHPSTVTTPPEKVSTTVIPLNTMFVGGADKQSTWWLVGGAHPSTVTTAPPSPSGVTSIVTVPPKPATTPSKVAKRQHVAPPTVPSMNAAVKLQPGSCITLCPNAVLHSSVTIASPTSGVKESGNKKKLNAAFIVLAIVLPFITTVAALVMGWMMLRYRSKMKALDNQRGKGLNVEMEEGYWRRQK